MRRSPKWPRPIASCRIAAKPRRSASCVRSEISVSTSASSNEVIDDISRVTQVPRLDPDGGPFPDLFSQSAQLLQRMLRESWWCSVSRHPPLRRKGPCLNCSASIAIAFASPTAWSRRLAGGRLAIETPSSRAIIQAGTGNAADQIAEIQFQYLGPSQDSRPLASGELRRQIGLKLRAAGQLQFDLCHVAHRARRKGGGFDQAKCRSAHARTVRRSRIHQFQIARRR